MRCVTKKAHGLKVRHHDDHMINPNEDFYVFHWEKGSDEICKIELNKIVLNSMPNSWNNQTYMQGFDCKTIT